jgi:hypothetical protein
MKKLHLILKALVSKLLLILPSSSLSSNTYLIHLGLYLT